jgi:hypothetical protein
MEDYQNSNGYALKAVNLLQSIVPNDILRFILTRGLHTELTDRAVLVDYASVLTNYEKVNVLPPESSSNRIELAVTIADKLVEPPHRG